MRKIFNEKINKLILGILAVSFFLLVFALTFKIHPATSPVRNTAAPGPAETNNAVLEINGNRFKGAITQDESVYDFMVGLKNEGVMDFADKSYAGMGKLVYSINGVANDGSDNWIYYVNDKKANIGISNYKLSPGDIVSWKYEKDTGQ